jgi:hypothetical protein
MAISDNWVYIIFAKDKKEFDRTVEELIRQHGLSPNADARFRVFAEDAMHISVLKQKLTTTVKEGKRYKHKAMFVYSPESVKSGLPTSTEHSGFISLHEQHLVRGEDFDTLSIETFIKTPEELDAEERQRSKDMEDWFVSRMRTIADV